MDNRCIGVFDSGLGGLTAVREIMEVLPHENIVYFGDTGRVPYGTRGKGTIIKYTEQDIRFLESFDVKQIVVACGTVSAVSLPHLHDKTKTPLIGVVHATANAAIHATRTKRIGVLGTSGTIHSRAFENALQKLDGDTNVFSKSCPLFVPLVENGHTDSEVARLIAKEYLADILPHNVDTLILGCTHYPHLKGIISEIMGENVTLIDPGVEVAKHLKEKLETEGLQCNASNKGTYRYFVSDDVKDFATLGSLFLQRDICGQVKKIDIEKY